MVRRPRPGACSADATLGRWALSDARRRTSVSSRNPSTRLRTTLQRVVHHPTKALEDEPEGRGLAKWSPPSHLARFAIRGVDRRHAQAWILGPFLSPPAYL